MKLKYSILLAVVALMSFTSCSDFLDKEPDTRVSLTSVEQLRLLLVNGYTTSNYGLLGEFSSDNVIDNNSPSSTGTRYNLSSYNRTDDELFAWEDARSDNGKDSPSDVWESAYHAIACANAVLEKVSQFEAAGNTSAELSAVKGEALLIRAYHHFILANIFCMPYRGPELSKNYPGIPYITAPETKVMVKYDRGTLAQTYDSIEADLVAGLPLINDSYYEVPKYHFNKAAANAFAARFYLFKREYDKVVEYADAAFGGPNVDPTPFMSKIWAQSTLHYLSDFGRYYSNTSQQRNFLVFATYSSYVRHFASGDRYTCNRDAKRATIQGPGPSWEGCRWKSSATGETFSMHPCFAAMCFTAGKQEYGAYFGGPVGEQFEYTDKVAGIGYAHEVRAEFTGEETLLCRAEAKLFLGDIDGAYADLNVWEKVRRDNPQGSDNMNAFTKDAIVKFYTRYASLPLYSGFGIVKPIHIDEVCPSDKYKVTDAILPYLQCVQHFRRIENVHNGMRWFDIKRLGLEITHYIGKDGSATLTVLDPRLALQIPNEIIAAGLTANDRTVVSPIKISDDEKFTVTPVK
jgi:hypothetical protein